MDEQHAIRLMRNAQDWTWEVMDHAGRTVAFGAAADQRGAMASAWGASKAASRLGSTPVSDFTLRGDEGARRV
jgi:hypothetical protein